MSSEKSAQLQWYYDNRDRVNTIRNQRTKCELCGGTYLHTNRSHHNKSKKHKQVEEIQRYQEETTRLLNETIKLQAELNKLTHRSCI